MEIIASLISFQVNVMIRFAEKSSAYTAGPAHTKHRRFVPSILEVGSVLTLSNNFVSNLNDEF
jgi:hypothetical protein